MGRIWCNFLNLFFLFNFKLHGKKCSEILLSALCKPSEKCMMFSLVCGRLGVRLDEVAKPCVAQAPA